MTPDDFKAWYAKNPLRKWRRANGLTMNQTAATLDVAVKSIQLWEQGVNSPRDNNYEKIADLIGIKVEKLTTQWRKWKDEQPTR